MLEPFRSGKSFTGKGGAFTPLFKQFLEAVLQSELEQRLCDGQLQPTFRRKNGKVSKTVKAGDGEIELITSRDRNDEVVSSNENGVPQWVTSIPVKITTCSGSSGTFVKDCKYLIKGKNDMITITFGDSVNSFNQFGTFLTRIAYNGQLR